MALTLPWLVAAVVAALGEVVWTPRPPLVEAVVSRVVNDTAARMAARRGVRLTRPLAVRLVDRGQLNAARAALADLPASEGVGRDGGVLGGEPAARRSFQETLYGQLGWPPAASAAPSSSDEVTGLYDLVHDRLLLANWADLGGARLPWVRDIGQALLDRRFDLGRWLPPPSHADGVANGADAGEAANTDRTLARQAIPSGDATAQALEELSPDGDLPSPRALAGGVAGVLDTIEPKLTAGASQRAAGAPSLDVQQRLFVELQGLTFVARLRARAPWSSVDEVWRRPPESTEQIIHPDRYERGESPDDVGARLPGQPHAAWRVVYRDTLGEWGIRTFLARAGDDYRAERAAAGWGGDRALLVRTAEPVANGADAAQLPAQTAANTFVAWITTWDDDTDADDFAAEAALALGDLARVSVLDARPSSGRLRLMDADGRLFAVERRRRTVGLLLAAPADAESFLAALMTAATTPPSPARRPARRPAAVDQARERPR